METSLQIGDELESTVHLIETAILKRSPSLKENTFKIEAKKIISVEGVRHEIDVYVEVDLGKGYKAIFIFECKNWQGKVGKNDIIIFSEKIDATQAQNGCFIAKSFTKYAMAQAKRDSRVTLIPATEHNADETPVPFDFSYTSGVRFRSGAPVDPLESWHHLQRFRPWVRPLERLGDWNCLRADGVAILVSFLREVIAPVELPGVEPPTAAATGGTPRWRQRVNP